MCEAFMRRNTNMMKTSKCIALSNYAAACKIEGAIESDIIVFTEYICCLINHLYLQTRPFYIQYHMQAIITLHQACYYFSRVYAIGTD